MGLTNKNSRIIQARISNDIYDSFALIAKEKGLSVGEYLRGIVERGVAKHFEGISPQDSQGVNPSKALPLIDKPVWYRPGVQYQPGQKVLVKQRKGGAVTVVVPSLDADGQPMES